MGKIQLDHTGSGGGVTLSSDGTDLLLDGTAVGGGGADLYAANEVSPTAQPSATGDNAIAIGDSAVSSGGDSVAIGLSASASSGVALGFSASSTGTLAAALGRNSTASGSNSLALGGKTTSGSSYSTAIGLNSGFTGSVTATGFGAMALGGSYASGTDSFAAAIANNTSSYGATDANSIAMGYQSKATSSNSIAIGKQNIAQSNIHCAAIGGLNNIASGSYAIIAGGNSNTASSARSAVLGGQQNNATESYSVVLGGLDNTASANRSVVLGGYGNSATWDYSIAMGNQAKSDKYGKIAHSAGRFTIAGDAQGAIYVLRASTPDATPKVLAAINGQADANTQIVAASDTCITFDGTITAMQNGAQAYASWKIEGLLVNDGGTTTLANSATTVISNGSGWGMALSADNTNNALAITCTGEASHNIRWVANIRTTEVTYA